MDLVLERAHLLGGHAPDELVPGLHGRLVLVDDHVGLAPRGAVGAVLDEAVAQRAEIRGAGLGERGIEVPLGAAHGAAGQVEQPHRGQDRRHEERRDHEPVEVGDEEQQAAAHEQADHEHAGEPEALDPLLRVVARLAGGLDVGEQIGVRHARLRRRPAGDLELLGGQQHPPLRHPEGLLVDGAERHDLDVGRGALRRAGQLGEVALELLAACRGRLVGPHGRREPLGRVVGDRAELLGLRARQAGPVAEADEELVELVDGVGPLLGQGVHLVGGREELLVARHGGGGRVHRVERGADALQLDEGLGAVVLGLPARPRRAGELALDALQLVDDGPPAVGGGPGAVHVGGRLTEGLAGLAQLGLEGQALRVVEAPGQAQLGGIDREQGAQLGGVTQGAERRRGDLGAVVEVAGLAVADHDAPPGRVAVDQRAARDLPRRGRSQGVDEPRRGLSPSNRRAPSAADGTATGTAHQQAATRVPRNAPRLSSRSHRQERQGPVGSEAAKCTVEQASDQPKQTMAWANEGLRSSAGGGVEPVQARYGKVAGDGEDRQHDQEGDARVDRGRVRSGAGRPSERSSQAHHATTRNGTARTNSRLWLAASTTCPWASAWVARRPPQKGQSRPVISLSGHSGKACEELGSSTAV